MNDETYNQTANFPSEPPAKEGYTSLGEELSSLQTYFMPNGPLAKGLELFGKISQQAIQLDESLLHLAQTSGLSAGELKKVTEESFHLGKALGRTGTEVLNFTAQAMQTGLGIKDAMAFANESLKAENLSAGILDADTAAQRLKHILSSFGKDASYASTVNDVLAKTAALSHTGFGPLLEQAAFLSDSAAQSGMSFTEMAGILAGAGGILKDTKETAKTMPALLTNLQNFCGEGIDVYDTLERLHETWNTLDEDARGTLSRSAAGEGQTELFSSLMEHWTSVSTAVDAASNSLGAADQANEAWLDSASGKTALLKNQLEALSASLLESDLLEFFLDVGTTGAEALQSITDVLSPMGTIAAAAGAYLGNQNLGRANNISRPF